MFVCNLSQGISITKLFMSKLGTGITDFVSGVKLVVMDLWVIRVENKNAGLEIELCNPS